MTAEFHATDPDDRATDSDGAAPDGADPDGADPSDRVREGVGHLQTAALEVIAAARVLLDAAEEVVGDQTSAAGLFNMLGDLARSARPAEPKARRSEHDDGHDDGDDGGVQRIRVT